MIWSRKEDGDRCLCPPIGAAVSNLKSGIEDGCELNRSIQSKVMAMAFSITAEIGGDLTSKRTREALMARRARGMRLRRPPGPGKSILDKYHEEIVALLKNGSTKSYVAQKYGTTVPNLYI